MTKEKSVNNLKELWMGYAMSMVLPTNNDWQTIPWYTKLSIFQNTPEKVVKKRTVWSKEVSYVAIDYVERALNFVSNFNRGIKVVDKWIKTYTQKNKKWEDVEQYDAWVQADCYIVLDGIRIDRTVIWTRKMSKNIAISDWAVYESARSQATKSFADTLWIWSDKNWSDNSKVQNARSEKQWTIEELDLSWFTSSKPSNEL